MANVNCPHCSSVLDIPDHLNGQQVACPICNQPFTAGGAASPTGGQSFQQQAAASFQNALGNVKRANTSLLVAMAAVVLAIIAIVMQIAAPKVPYAKFEKDPEDALESMLEVQIKAKALDSYFWRENGGEVIDSLKIVETEVDGNSAAVYYSLSKGATTVKDVAFFKCNKDGYYIPCSQYDLPEDFRKKIGKSVSGFTKGSLRDFEK